VLTALGQAEKEATGGVHFPFFGGRSSEALNKGANSVNYVHGLLRGECGGWGMVWSVEHSWLCTD
jgi:hypothetical protein